MPPVTASTKSMKSVKLSVGVSGISMSEMEAQKFASSIQSNLAYTLGVEPNNLEVEVSAEAPYAEPAGETEMEVEVELPEEMSAADISGMDPKAFAKNKAAIKAKMGAK
jgi:hypothetical protein